MTGQQTDDVMSLFVEHENGGIFEFALQRACDHANGNARSHDEDQGVVLAEGRLNLRCKTLVDMHIFKRPLTCLGEDVDTRVKSCPNAKRCARAARRRGEYGAPHLLASRNIWLNSGAYRRDSS